MIIKFFFQDVKISISGRNKLKLFIVSVFRREKKPLRSLNYVFCSDEHLLEINRRFLIHDYFTDIISFNLAEKGVPVEGEIYISVDRVKDNAKRMGLTVKEELHRVIFHGALHLCGYKDKTNSEKKSMSVAENKHLEFYFYNRST